MTNKDLLDSISQEMKELYKKREAELEEVSKSKYSDWLKKLKRWEIMDNFYAEMDKFKGRPWYEEAIKTARHEKSLRWKLERLERQRELLQEKYEQAQIAHRWQVEFTEEIEITEELRKFREKWKQEIDLDEYTKNKIIATVEKIQKRANKEKDWSMLVEFELWWETYKTLDVNLGRHSDIEYLTSYEYIWQEKDKVYLRWMIWDETSNRKNKKLKEYVQAKEREWFVIKKIEEMKELLDKLWAAAGLKDESDKIAMWTYLTWNYGDYLLTMWDNKKSDKKLDSRSSLKTDYCYFSFGYGFTSASLCLIACM